MSCVLGAEEESALCRVERTCCAHVRLVEVQGTPGEPARGGRSRSSRAGWAIPGLPGALDARGHVALQSAAVRQGIGMDRFSASGILDPTRATLRPGLRCRPGHLLLWAGVAC